MFDNLSKMILNAQRDAQTPEAHDPHRRRVITSPRATRRNSTTYQPIIRTFW